MPVNLKDNSMSRPQNSCPDIGLKEDSATFSAFPSQMNACHHVRPVQVPKIPHQRTYCLQSAHIHCPIFEAQPGGRMPKEFKKTRRLSKKTWKLLICGGVITMLLFVVLVWLFIGRPWFSIPDEEISPTQTQPAAAPLETWLVTVAVDLFTQTPSPTQAPPTPTNIPPTSTQEDPILALETPIGGEIQFIIHRVKEGETLQIFADQYNTTVAAITAINYDLIVPLWINWLVVIPLNITDVSNLPAFEAYQVEEEGVSVQALAEQLSVSLEDMMRYNNLDANHALHEGEWLLIPRERFQP
jgi:LysM repeat protein